METPVSSPAKPEGPRSRAQFLMLTLLTGALNAISFLALGGVFVSVMTANLALVGIAVGGSDPDLARNSLVALAGYVTGVLLGARYRERCEHRNRTGVRALLGGELLLLCGVLAGWLVTDGSPPAHLRTVLLGTAALAMGCQSAAVRAAAPPGVSTTYMTGLLTAVLTDVLARRRTDWGRAALLAAIPAGAALGTLVVGTARTAAPLLPVVLLAAVLALSGANPG
ncbi:YoaK family protein [Streptomyces sp. WMMC940]|uniref:YoaK family protein n=1 Tax=Streptomyces sp. WMMC940 TaxID=3015153 RepID=UPI0022B702EF|nr:YoaK family protein [Streptomyces sp. WMMC940]MCZ7456607.1 YoaK family protein [Streptomyces sp. WMMC940]